MKQSEILNVLKAYVSKEILGGEDIDASSPLIEWGIIDSMRIVQLVAAIHERFGVEVPGDKMTLEHFRSLQALSQLVMDLHQSRA